jgi:hypothetical protein
MIVEDIDSDGVGFRLRDRKQLLNILPERDVVTDDEDSPVGLKFFEVSGAAGEDEGLAAACYPFQNAMTFEDALGGSLLFEIKHVDHFGVIGIAEGACIVGAHVVDADLGKDEIAKRFEFFGCQGFKRKPRRKRFS